MNKYQRVIVIVAAVNIALMLLFPPFLDNPIRRGVMPNFEGFYPLLTGLGSKAIHKELLTLQIMFVVINALIAWLLLDRPAARGLLPDVRYTRAIGFFLFGNLLLLFAFPPFETYPSLFKYEPTSFDSFYFVFGDKRHRHFFIPLLYLEVMVVVINSLTLWLLFNTVQRGEIAAKDRILQLVRGLPPEDLEEVKKTLSYRVAIQNAHKHEFGAGSERRAQSASDFSPNRRSGRDRRSKPR